MKSYKILATALALSLAISSCEKAKDLIDTKIEFSLDETFTAKNANGEYLFSTVFSSLDDANISDNMADIKSYSIESVTVTLENLETETDPSFDKIDILITGTTNIINLPITSSDGAISLKGLQAQGAYDITPDGDAAAALLEIIESGEDVSLKVSGTIDDGPATFDMAFSIKGKVVVGL